MGLLSLSSHQLTQSLLHQLLQNQLILVSVNQPQLPPYPPPSPSNNLNPLSQSTAQVYPLMRCQAQRSHQPNPPHLHLPSPATHHPLKHYPPMPPHQHTKHQKGPDSQEPALPHNKPSRLQAYETTQAQYSSSLITAKCSMLNSAKDIQSIVKTKDIQNNEKGA